MDAGVKNVLCFDTDPDYQPDLRIKNSNSNPLSFSHEEEEKRKNIYRYNYIYSLCALFFAKLVSKDSLSILRCFEQAELQIE